MASPSANHPTSDSGRHHPPVGETQGKREQVEAMFDSIAPRYDLLNRVLSFGIDQWWRRQAVDCLQAARPHRVLDVATGTGDLALLAAERLNSREVVGIDIADEMLRIGREKIASRDRGHQVRLLRADAAELPFESDSFDAALVAFGVRNFENLHEGLCEIRRVLRPGGRLVVLEFSKPRMSPIKELYEFYSRFILPVIGQILSGDEGAYKYLPASVQVFPDGLDFLERMSEAGYNQRRWRQLTFGIASLYVGSA